MSPLPQQQLLPPQRSIEAGRPSPHRSPPRSPPRTHRRTPPREYRIPNTASSPSRHYSPNSADKRYHRRSPNPRADRRNMSSRFSNRSSRRSSSPRRERGYRSRSRSPPRDSRHHLESHSHRNRTEKRRYRDYDEKPRPQKRLREASLSPARSREYKEGPIYEYTQLEGINHGSFGAVYLGRDNRTGTIVAIKRLRKEAYDERSKLYLREFDALETCNHEHIVALHELAGNNRGDHFIVMEYCEYDLRRFLNVWPKLEVPLVKNLLRQCLSGLSYLHDIPIIHRDLKTENLLINAKGVLKIADLGSCRRWRPDGEFTPNLVTLRYRPLELFLGTRLYTTAIDMWSFGCIMAELLAGTGKPFFAGTSELEQIDRVCEVLGSPDEESWPGLRKLELSRVVVFPQRRENRLRDYIDSLDDAGEALLKSMLDYNPDRRISAKKAMEHEYFSVDPLPAPMGSLPDVELLKAAEEAGMFD